MKQEITPRHIRRLLESYYDGSASAADEALLVEYFNTATEVDADLETDRAIFRAIAATRTSTPEPPADLEQRILDATVGRERRRLSIPRWLSILSAAAAIALIVSIGLRVSTHNDNVAAPDTPVKRLVAELRDTSQRRDTIAIANLEVTVVPPPASGTAAKESVAPVSPAKEYDPYIEITDSAEAVEYTRLMLQHLDATLSPAVSGLRSADVAVANINEKIKNINNLNLNIKL